MKQIPMLFSTPMAIALLDNRKTQTRRLIKHKLQPVRDEVISGRRLVKPVGWPLMNIDEYTERFCPYGKPGDLLYVRETWFPAAINSNRVLVGYHEKDPDITIEITTDRVEYYWKQLHKGRMIPSIHMPKEAARIWLQVTGIRVERLQDISQDDAQAEGVERMGYGSFPWKHYASNTASCVDAKTSFESLWREINGDESWEANPWVWRVSFKIISTTGHP